MPTTDRSAERLRQRRFALRLTEVPRALSELGALAPSAPALLQARRGDGHPVLVMPGLGGSDLSTAVLRRYLETLGHNAQPWELGRNLGPAMDNLTGQLTERFEAVFEAGGRQPVSLVGWSLGGVYARLLAQHSPERVRQVITLGSPFGGASTSTRQAAHPDLARLRRLASQPLPGIPSSAVFSRTDAVVPWQLATQAPSELAENIEVRGSHIGLGFNPSVLYAVADRLGQHADGWQPFGRDGWKARVYGPADIGQAAA